MKRKTYHRLYPTKSWKKYPEDKFFKEWPPKNWVHLGVKGRLNWVDDFIARVKETEKGCKEIKLLGMRHWAADIRAEVANRIGRKQ